MKRRSFIKTLAVAPAALSPLLWSQQARAEIGPTLTIAYNIAPPGFDPNSGSYATSPGLQSIFKTLYDPYIGQAEDLSLQPGLMDEFSWSPNRDKISMRLREGAFWHDGKPVSLDDVLWNLRRLREASSGNPLSTVFASIKNLTTQGNVVTFDVEPWRANMLERFTFLACYLIPPHYYEAVGKEGFERRPMGSGPYMFDQFERGSFLRLKVNPHYWGPKPAFDTVVFKFIVDPAGRVAEIERGASDITLDVPYEEYERLSRKTDLVGVAHPITDIALLFLNNNGIMEDANVRKAAAHAIDKKLIVERLHRGMATPIDTLLAPQYKGYDPSITTPYDPALAERLLKASGYSRDKPVEFTIQTTRGYKPKDYETVLAIVEMWRKVGIKANVEVYEIAKHFELRAQHKLAPAAFYNWGNSTADPESSLGTAMVMNSPHASWQTPDLDGRIRPLFEERDEAKRLAGYKAVNRYIAENAFVIPLFQFYQPVIYKRELTFTPHLVGHILPAKIGRA
ncbi:ABC transporter substrate-binding protein [Pusillimonas noertemannii]|uniref:Peptide/nickel transport system substrate-binding protein n=1 Tax=Pusillimonas noertemannii TaxID=305977 RepID=A0A2U1CKY8_9BURK|nr:ABC transporter substrate-binding protein [Pusillimonas noertemannii]NYT69199.1 twin-arginine translocation signal domain-containing protein [Pusillimonas noertemannii]PVY61667.1 peptide/nickel transport system substrate-binding protein [Pusillimonas noertemannii]TFL09608.1 twin-arginine translocation signal domain-containing protein [Pusillimonas noertemannii]